MKFKFALLLLLAAGNVFSGIETKYDRFAGLTVVSTLPTSQIGRASIVLTPEWIATFTGEKPTKVPNFVNLQFWKINKSWQYLNCHSVSMLADGLPFPSAKSKHEGNVGRSQVTEIITVVFSHADVTKLSEAKTVEFKVCNTESRFSEDEMQDLREFVKATTP